MRAQGNLGLERKPRTSEQYKLGASEPFLPDEDLHDDPDRSFLSDGDLVLQILDVYDHLILVFSWRSQQVGPSLMERSVSFHDGQVTWTFTLESSPECTISYYLDGGASLVKLSLPLYVHTGVFRERCRLGAAVATHS